MTRKFVFSVKLPARLSKLRASDSYSLSGMYTHVHCDMHARTRARFHGIIMKGVPCKNQNTFSTPGLLVMHGWSIQTLVILVGLQKLRDLCVYSFGVRFWWQLSMRGISFYSEGHNCTWCPQGTSTFLPCETFFKSMLAIMFGKLSQR